MKKVEAIIRHSKLQNVKDALVKAGVEGMTVTEVMGRGHKKGSLLQYRGVTAEQPFAQNTKVEVIVADSEAESVVDAIFQSAQTGKVGDGRIVVTQIESVTRIRTGEVDETDKDFVQHRFESNVYATV